MRGGRSEEAAADTAAQRGCTKLASVAVQCDEQCGEEAQRRGTGEDTKGNKLRRCMAWRHHHSNGKRGKTKEK